MMLTLAIATLLAQEPVAVAVPHKGKPGVWFTLEEARRLNAVDLKLPLLETKITALETHNTDLRKALDVYQSLPPTKISVTNPTPWYKSPVLWFSVGLVTGASAIIFVQ